MKRFISFSLILSLLSSLGLPLHPAFALHSQNETLIAQRRGGGGGRSVNRGSSGRSMNRSSVGASGSGRVNRSDVNRSSSQRVNNRQNLNLNDQRTGSNRVNRDQARNRTNNVDREQARNRTNNVDREQARNRTNNVDREQARNRTNNVDRDMRNQLNNIDRNNVNNRVNNIDRNNANDRLNNRQDINLSNDRRYSNRVNRNVINTGNRAVIVNPRPGWGGWGWNRGVAWAPNYGYWGGGFWGAFAIGAATAGITAAVVSAANNNDEPDYIIIQQDAPGYQLFDSYGLTQVRCVEDNSQVYIYGPQDSLICAIPNELVPAGYYDVDPTDLTLIAR